MIKIGDYREAYKNLLSIEKRNDIIYFYLGNIVFFEKKYDLAIKYYTLSIKANNSMAEAYNNLGVCYVKLNSFHKAKKVFIESINKRENYLDAHNNLQCLINKKNDYRLTTKELRKELLIYGG